MTQYDYTDGHPHNDALYKSAYNTTHMYKYLALQASHGTYQPDMSI